MRAVFLERISPAQTIAIDEDNPTLNASVVDARLTMGLREVRLQTRHLRIAEPEENRHITALFWRGESCPRFDQWVLSLVQVRPI